MALGEQVVIGAVAGGERSRLLLSDGTDSLHGVILEWSPGPRTSLSAELEQRLFGRTGRRLTPQVSANALAVWSKIVGLAARAGDATRERSHRLSLTRKLSARTGVSSGVQLNRFATTVSGRQPDDETLLFVGMSHRF